VADTNLNITVTSNDKSIDAVNAKIKELTKQYKALSEAGRKNRPDLAAEIDQWKNYRTQALEPIIGAQGKMMQSYFKTGEELRRFYREQRLGDRTMREATQTVQVFGSMLGGEGLGKIVGTAVGGFQQMEFATNALGISAVGAGGKMASFGQTLIAMSGPLAAVAGGAGLVYLAFENARKATEEFNKAAQDFYKSLVDIGKVTKEQQVGELTRRINALQQQPPGGPGLLSMAMGPAGAFLGFEERAAAAMRRETEINKLLKERADLEKQITDENVKRAQARGMLQVGGSTVFGSSPLSKVGIRGTISGMRAGRVGAGAETSIDVAFDEADKRWQELGDSVSSGVSSMASLISSQVGGAFASVFGGARTMAGAFFGSFTQSLTQLATTALAKFGLGSAFPFLIPFMAGGGPVSSNRPYIVGERGPELFIPRQGGEIVSNAKMSRMGGGSMGVQTIRVVGEISGNNLVLVQKKAGLARRGRTM
jgi:hypothetical protein